MHLTSFDGEEVQEVAWEGGREKVKRRDLLKGKGI